MATYDLFANHYDAVTGDSFAEATFVDSLIKQADANAVTLLELACGTGGIISVLAGKYQVSGLDISPGMLAVARDKLPAGTPLYTADMTSFTVNVKFDTVICIYHGINHLLGFPAWERFFDRVHAHLNDGGVFVFDIEPIGGLKLLASREKEVQQFGENYLVIRVRTRDELVYDWNIEVFERQRAGDYTLLTAVVRTVSFPLAQIQAALRRRFTDIKMVDGAGDAVTEDGVDRVWFVCTKPGSGSGGSGRPVHAA